MKAKQRDDDRLHFFQFLGYAGAFAIGLGNRVMSFDVLLGLLVGTVLFALLGAYLNGRRIGEEWARDAWTIRFMALLTVLVGFAFGWGTGIFFAWVRI